MTRITILCTQEHDWKAVYIDNDLVHEGHSLPNPRFWLDCGKAYGENCTLKHTDLNDEDDADVCDDGFFPKSLTELKGNYDHR